ncbi:MAG: glycerophosphodiester phosphodiesterase family protein [Arenicella sp.]
MAKKNKANGVGVVPQLIAHRGYSGRYPENTLLAYQAAYAYGGRWMELDIQLTEDLIPIVHHDVSLQRMAGVDLDIRRVKAKQLKKYSAFYPERFADEFVGNGFTKLKHLVKWASTHKDIRLFIEIKQQSIDEFGVPVCMDEVFRRIKKIQQQCVIISFNDEILDYARKTNSLEVGWVIPEWSDSVQQRAEQLQPEFLFTNKKHLPEDKQSWWSGSWVWAIYNVDTPEEALQWFDKGIDLIETNELGLLVRHEAFANGS